MSEPHPHWAGQSALLSLQIQMLISSRKALIDPPRIMFSRISGHTVAQSNRHIKLIITRSVSLPITLPHSPGPEEEGPIPLKGTAFPVLILVLQARSILERVLKEGKPGKRKVQSSREAIVLVQKKAVDIGKVKQNYRLQMIVLIDQNLSNTQVKILCKETTQNGISPKRNRLAHRNGKSKGGTEQPSLLDSGARVMSSGTSPSPSLCSVFLCSGYFPRSPLLGDKMAASNSGSIFSKVQFPLLKSKS